jgi:hypothetical protein
VASPFASQLKAIREACVVVAHRNTPGAATNSLSGNRIESAVVLRLILGGDLMHGYIDGRPHTWNRLPSGDEIDLASDELGGDGFTPVISGVTMPVLDSPLPAPSVLFAQAVLSEMALAQSPKPIAGSTAGQRPKAHR